ncbi:hypothetical protein GCM10007901_09280 [Dyella acidisoli]|uniref:Uncharacterized protein n=1 Tax=Dyella acidisoli TaxID=1867834 RepID=A0ABQ5XKS3_9GAMM|nr:hypothetical protein GCM10007901_09280 [Dyella acidisoli]
MGKPHTLNGDRDVDSMPVNPATNEGSNGGQLPLWRQEGLPQRRNGPRNPHIWYQRHLTEVEGLRSFHYVIEKQWVS